MKILLPYRYIESPSVCACNSIYFELHRCKAPMSGALPAFSIVLDGPQLLASNPFKFCSSDGDCGSDDLYCADLNKAARLEDAFRDRKVQVEGRDTKAWAYPLAGDVLSVALYGQANNQKDICKAKPWYSKSTQRVMRHVIRSLSNAPSDGGTEHTNEWC